jgi:hypothetical protein
MCAAAGSWTSCSNSRDGDAVTEGLACTDPTLVRESLGDRAGRWKDLLRGCACERRL